MSREPNVAHIAQHVHSHKVRFEMASVEKVRPKSNEATSETHLAGVARRSASEPTQNFGSGGILKPGDKYEIHPAAAKFRHPKGHLEKLRESIMQHGQRNDIVVMIMGDGTPLILDGVSRTKILTSLNEPVAYRIITERDLNGRTTEQWIVATNFAGSEGRNYSDSQRAVQIVELDEELEEAIEKARKRSNLGKKADQAEKGTVALHLARLANVNESRVQQVLDVKKHAKNEDEFKKFADLLWSGKCVVSKLLKVVKIDDSQERGDGIAALRDGDKRRLARALGEAPARDGLKVTIPNDLLPLFEKKAKAVAALKLLKKATDRLTESGVEAKHIEVVEHECRRIELSLPYAMCDVCNFTGRDHENKDCGRCGGKRYVTLREFEADREACCRNIPHA